MQQQQEETPLKPCLVYFGCRDPSEELYSEQMRKWVDSGVITGLHVAMSRGKGPKVRPRSVCFGGPLACCVVCRVSGWLRVVGVTLYCTVPPWI